MYVYSPNTQKRWRQMDEKFKVKPGTPEIPTQKQAAIHPPKKCTQGLKRSGKEDTKMEVHEESMRF